MYKFSKNNFLEQIFSGKVSDMSCANGEDVTPCVEICGSSYMISKKELTSLGTKVMFQCELYKSETFYVLFDQKELTTSGMVSVNNANVVGANNGHIDDGSSVMISFVNTIFKPLFDRISNFYKIMSLKDLCFYVKNVQKKDLSLLTDTDYKPHSYLMPVKVFVGNNLPDLTSRNNPDAEKVKEVKAYFLIPLKLLKILIFLLTDKDITKMTNPSDITTLMDNLESCIIGAKSFFPYKINDFFNQLGEEDFTNIITKMLSSSMLSYDMLYALTRILDNGTDRIMGALSKKRKEDFIKNTQDKIDTFDKKWIQTANYHTLCNLNMLIEKNKYESPVLNQFKAIIRDVETYSIKKMLAKKPLPEWIESAKQNKNLHTTFSNCSLITVAKAISDEDESILKDFESSISKRAFQDLKNDVEYVRDRTNSYDRLMAKMEFIERYSESLFKKIPYKKRHINLWADFKDSMSVNYVFNYVGPVLFSLATMEMDEKHKRLAIKGLNVPAKYFLEGLLYGDIKLSIPYGRSSIVKAAEDLSWNIFKLNIMGRIRIVEPSIEDDNK